MRKLGAGSVLVVGAAFKAVVRDEESLGCVRFAHGSANIKGKGKMKKYLTFGLAIMLACTVILSAGCSSQKKTVKKDEPQVVEVGAKVNGTLANGYPEELPLWGGATVKDSKDTKKGQSEAYEAEFLIKGAFDNISYGYGKGLTDAGWDAQTISQDKTSALISATKDDVSAAITISGNSDGTVSVVVSAQKM